MVYSVRNLGDTGSNLTGKTDMTNFEAELAADAKRAPSQDKLDYVRDKVRYMRDLDLKIAEVEELGKQLRGERRELEMITLPDLFMQTGITHIGLEAEGNMPAYEAKIKDYYHANIKADWPQEQRQEALDWLEKHHLSDIVKTVITIELGKGKAKLLQQIITALRTLKVPFTKQQTVPWNTLTAVVKERHDKGRPMGDNDLRILGATVGKQIKLTPKHGD